MIIPERILSQGIWWKVRYSDDIENLAETNYDALEIIISNTIPVELQEAAFFHELHHTINTTVDHALMDSITMQYFQILKDNNFI